MLRLFSSARIALCLVTQCNNSAAPLAWMWILLILTKPIVDYIRALLRRDITTLVAIDLSEVGLFHPQRPVLVLAELVVGRLLVVVVQAPVA